MLEAVGRISLLGCHLLLAHHLPLILHMIKLGQVAPLQCRLAGIKAGLGAEGGESRQRRGEGGRQLEWDIGRGHSACSAGMLRSTEANVGWGGGGEGTAFMSLGGGGAGGRRQVGGEGGAGKLGGGGRQGSTVHAEPSRCHCGCFITNKQTAFLLSTRLNIPQC